MSQPHTVSLRRLHYRMARAPWGVRLAAAMLALALVFALTPCCDVLGAPPTPAAHAASGHDSADHDHDGGHAPGGDPCAAWLDRSDAVPPKADGASSPGVNAVPATPFVLLPNAMPVATAWRPFRLSASPPGLLYLRHLRLIL